MGLDDPVRVLIADMGRVPATLRRQMTKALIRAAGPIVDDAKARASWSTRIPPAFVVRTRYAGSRPGVTIRVRAAIAPHARPYEGFTGYTTFRHRVHGRDVWVTQRTRPFAAPAVIAKAGVAVEAVVAAIEDSARLHGWR